MNRGQNFQLVPLQKAKKKEEEEGGRREEEECVL